jgi:esterase/lipase superfamily enzyme
VSWEELVEASEKRKRRVKMRVQDIRELGRYPASPAPFHLAGGQITDDLAAVAAERAVSQRFRAELERRLDGADRREVIVFIHGFNTTFEKAALLHAEVWHFLGRRGVPIVYSWPAATRGILGYVSDRESEEFTIFHLKLFLRELAATTGLERVHILAHSRGTDVATTALRELVIETRASGREPREVFRIANLVLAAPDLDFGTVGQRLIAERFGPAFGRITIYTDQSDRALDASELLFGGVRFGRVRTEDVDVQEKSIFRAVGNVQIVESRGATDRFRHEYFRSSREVSSDLVLVLRDGLAAGVPARPLIREEGNFWSIPRGYPLEEAED